jgi:hypothetical protein
MSHHILRPPSEKTFNIADALAGLPRCILTLEAAVVELRQDFRDDAKRGRVRELARSLSAGCPECGFRESSNALRTIEGLLALKPDTCTGLDRSLGDRLLELVAILKAQALENKS